jgi:hypothetical protein
LFPGKSGQGAQSLFVILIICIIHPAKGLTRT